MKFNIKAFSCIAIALSLLSFGFYASAQAENNAVFDPSHKVPEISITELTLPKTTYAAGDQVMGAFTLKNRMDTPVSDIYYNIKLVSGYDSKGQVSGFYDSKQYGPVSLLPGEMKTISFKYSIGSAFSGNLGIQVEATENGVLPLAWLDQKIKVTGGGSAATLGSLNIISDKVKYAIGDIPVVKTSASLHGEVHNSGTNDLTLTPKGFVYFKTTANPPRGTITAPSITLKPNATVSFDIPLPTYDFAAPGLYDVELGFFDGSGILRTPSLSFHYTLAGDTVILYSLFADKTSGSTGDSITVSVHASGDPYYPPVPGARLTINLFNEKNEPVGSYDQAYDFSQGDSKIVNITLTGDAKALRGDAIATKDGKTLSSISVKLSPDYDQVVNQMLLTNGGNEDGYITLRNTGIVGILVIIFLLVLSYEVKKKRPASSKKMVAIAALLVLGAFSFAPHKVQAITDDSYTVYKNETNNVARNKANFAFR